jgi:hypothetical protein
MKPVGDGMRIHFVWYVKHLSKGFGSAQTTFSFRILTICSAL